MIQITPWLYVGQELAAYNKSLLNEHQIGAMLNLNEPVNIPNIESHHLFVMDRAGFEQNDMDQALDFIFRVKQQGANVLITSNAGVSRSAAFAIAAVKKDENISLLGACKQVLQRHPGAKPHPALWYSLENYFDEKCGFNSVLGLYEEMENHRANTRTPSGKII